MKKAGHLFFVLGLMGAMAAPVCADTLFTTLGPGGSYVSGSYYTVGAPSDAVQGFPFTLDSGTTVSDAVLALGYGSGPNSPVDVYIESNSGGEPGSEIVTLNQVGTIPALGSGGGLVTFDCSGAGCKLEAGTYWLVAVESNPSSQQAWFAADGLPSVGLVYNYSGSPTGPWSTAIFDDAAFQIDGSTPEPSSFVLLVSGLLGLAWVLRRNVLGARLPS